MEIHHLGFAFLSMFSYRVTNKQNNKKSFGSLNHIDHSDQWGISTFVIYDILHALGEILSTTTISYELKNCHNKKHVQQQETQPTPKISFR